MTDRPDNFADYPTLLNDVRSDRTDDARHWTPRDALIELLRAIDQGKVNPDMIVICFREQDADGPRAKYRMAGADNLTALGVLARISAAIGQAR